MRLHHVQVSCPRGGKNAARSFYGDVLGLPETAGGGNRVEIFSRLPGSAAG